MDIATQMCLDHATVLPSERQSLMMASGRVLAGTVVARVPLPPFPPSVTVSGASFPCLC